LVGEEITEFKYQLVACKKTYRMIVLRKKLDVKNMGLNGIAAAV
jgi:hypothetical protein